MSTKRVLPRGRRFALPAAVAALLATGGVAAAVAGGSSPEDQLGITNAHSGKPVTYADTVTKPADSQAPDAATRIQTADAATQVVNGLGALHRVQKITAAGSDVSVALDQNDDDVPSVWAAGLAVGAFAERTHTSQVTANEAVTKATAVGPNKNGVTTTTALGVGAVSLGQRFGSPSDATLSQRVNDVADQFGLKVAAVEVLHPLESALKVTFVIPTADAPGWTVDKLRTALVGDSPIVEGVLIEIDAANGDPLLRSGVAYRTGEGGLWFAPGQDERFGALHGGVPRS